MMKFVKQNQLSLLEAIQNDFKSIFYASPKAQSLRRWKQNQIYHV